MRSTDKMFSSLLLNIGNGNIENFDIKDYKTDDVCYKVYRSTINIYNDISNKIILCPHNEETNVINKKILDKLPGKETIYYSIDSLRSKGIDSSQEEAAFKFQPEVLQKMKFPGFTPSKLILKKGAIVILIRNLSSKDGLCNGTRLKVLEL